MDFRKYLSNVRDYDSDDVLDMIGLHKKSSTDWMFPMLAGLGAGMAIGAGLAFFLTPYKGEEMREKLVKGATEAKGYLESQAGKISENVQKAIGTESSSATPAVAAARPMNVGGSIGTGGVGGNRGY